MSSEKWTTFPALAHALPFRTIFGEYHARRKDDLAQAVLQHILQQKETLASQETRWEQLSAAVKESEDAYRALAQAKQDLQSLQRQPHESLGDFRAKIAEAYERTLLAERVCQIKDRPLKAVLHAMGGTAVCLSGGGIRSASFSLGVLEGLARFSRHVRCVGVQKPLLDGLDYLSTVSGGGYIGSWLMAWAHRSNYNQVIDQMSESAKTSGDPEPQPIRHLREYTSYLTPRYGFTLDTLTLLSIVSRNLVLNWLILVPAVIAMFCLPEYLYDLSYGWPFACQRSGISWFYWVMGAAIVCVVVASGFAVWRMVRPPHTSEVKDRQKQGSATLELCFFALPLMLAAWLATEASAWAYISHSLGDQWSIYSLTKWLFVFTFLPPFAMAVVRLRLLWHSDGKLAPTALHKHDGTGRIAWKRVIWSFIAPIIVAVLAAALLAVCALFIGSKLIEANEYHVIISRKFVAFGVPIVFVVLMLSSTVLTGLLTNIEQEEEREWWARAGGLLFACVLCWLGVTCVAFFAANTIHVFGGAILTAVGLGAGYVGSAAGLSAATTSGLKRVKIQQLTKFEKFLANHDLVAPFTSAVALICLALALAALTSWLRFRIWDYFDGTVLSPYPTSVQADLVKDLALKLHYRCTPVNFASWIETVDQLKLDVLATSVVFAGAAILALFANVFININTFSLHGMYRMRLTRAYLGASNFARHADTFTNFDSNDNLHITDLPSKDVPLHIVNTALNLVATRNMAWQQRKAEPFTFSPLCAGSWRVGYIAAGSYGGSRGVTLGTAMAISGAAFNPNMGYNSSPLVTLLMTFFNARLGWWLPNPIWPLLSNMKDGEATDKFRHRNGPMFALMPLVNEALGNTNDSYKWVELSDGGHFENLGLYEMVLRRCRRIVVVDADADPDFQFEDLGNAIRKINIDLGVIITFPDYPLGLPMKRGVEPTNINCLRGVIDYGSVDEGHGPGELLFIKPLLNGSEPADIRAYASSHQTFPHEATTNQFFNESQFESYRHLGSNVIQAIIEPGSINQPTATGATPAPLPPGCDMEAFFTRVKLLHSTGEISVVKKIAASPEKIVADIAAKVAAKEAIEETSAPKGMILPSGEE